MRPQMPKMALLFAALLTATGGCGKATEDNKRTEAAVAAKEEAQKQAEAAIERVGGRISWIHRPGKPEVEVDLRFRSAPDKVLVYLKGLEHLRALNLNFSNATDAGLAHLEGLTELRVLNLYGTKITDAGL